MKKYLLLLASAALLLVGCAKEQNVDTRQGGDLTSVTFTASVDGGVATKAVTDGDGAAANVNRCIMEIYYGDALYARQYAKVESKQATFTAQVVSNRTYTVVFWADKVEDATTADGLATDKYYTTTSLKEITLKDDAYAGNDDARDAFFHFGTYTVAQSGSSWGDIKLNRPFAQMNVITTDWDKVTKVEELKPEKVKVTLKNALVKFNAVTGEASGPQDLTYEAAVYEAPASTGEAPANEKTLSMDYLFASTAKGLIDIEWKALHGTDDNVERSFSTVPYQRNYRTNIKGALLTTTGNWTVEIAPAWLGDGTSDDDPWLENYDEKGSIAAANQALKEGKTAILIKNPTDVEHSIEIPSEANGKDISIKTEGTNGNTLTFNGATGPANLYIASDAENLTINCPVTHVELTSGTYTQVTAKTSATTLVIAKDVKVENLKVEQGNVEIHGVVDALERTDGVKAEMYASDRTTLVKHLNLAQSDDLVALESDIDLAGADWTPCELHADFNGNGHTIKNMKNTSCAPDYAGLFNVSYSNIKNVTIQDAEFAYGATMNARGAALVGDMRRGSIENCHVEGVKFTGYQKVGGLVGYISVNADNGSDISIKNCSVKNATFAACGADDEYLYQTGGLVGYIQLGNRNISISNCSVENIKYDNAHKGVYDKEGDNSGYLSHTFVGAIFSQTNNAANTLAFTDNTISGDNTPLKANMYGSAYFGWARNPEFKPSETVTLGKITIDGQEWAPNYPVKIVGGNGYATLDAALSAATAGQTVQILKAGEYKTDNLSTNASVVEAIVDGVVFNHTTAATSWVASCNGTTVKNVTWNVGTAHHQYFSNTNLENCTVNGLLCTHNTNKFKDCTFINEEGYNFWVYGNEYTEFDNCTFTCPGKNDGASGCGSALNCYNEGAQAHTSVLVIKNCTFTAKEASNKYSAIYVKPETTFDIRITNSTCNDKFCTGAISGSKLWNLTADREGTTVSIDGNMVYPFCSKDSEGNYHIINADGLLQFHDLYAAGKVAYTAKVYIDNDIDFTGKTWTACEWHADKATKGFALFDGQNHTIKNFTVSGQGMFSRWACTSNIGATPYFKDIVFDGAKNVTSTLNVSLFCGQVYQNAKIENVTIKNSQIEGTYKVAPFVGTVYDEKPANSVTLTMKDCKVENTTVRSTKYNYCTCGMVAWVSDIDDKDKIVFEGNNVVKDVTLYKSNVSYNLFGKIYWGDGDNDGVAHDEAANVTVSNVNVVPIQ